LDLILGNPYLPEESSSGGEGSIKFEEDQVEKVIEQSQQSEDQLRMISTQKRTSVDQVKRQQSSLNTGERIKHTNKNSQGNKPCE
jgi:hypothetical protein